jgi:spore coat polysaccharide biosynthesis predicted glycosyltransferase SpsG
MSALAEAFVARGCECVFFTGDDEPIDFSGFNIVILDTYKISDEYISSLRATRRVLVCIDDNALYTYDCDALVNHNFHAPGLNFNFAAAPPKLLLGPKFALLRGEFSNTAPIKINENAADIFVCFGGSDVRNFTPQAVKALRKITAAKLTVVLGSHTNCDAEVFALACENVRVLKNPAHISREMQNCDIAVTAAGSMVYELSALGIPSILITMAENQFYLAEFLQKNNLMHLLGNWDKISLEELRRETENLLGDFARRKREHENLIKTVDRNGTKNIADEILKMYTHKNFASA